MTEPGDNSIVHIDFDELRTVIDDLANDQTTVSEASGFLRANIKAVIEEKGWHKGALNQIRKIDGMSETARADYLRTFLPMLNVMRQNGWDDDVQDMIDELEDDTALEAAE